MFIRVSQHANLTANVSLTDLKSWHEKLGHVHVRTLKKLVDLKLVSGVKLDDKTGFFSELCQIGKVHRLQFIDFEKESTNYRLYDPATKKVTVSRNVTFSGRIKPLVEYEEKGVALLPTLGTAPREDEAEVEHPRTPDAAENDRAAPAAAQATPPPQTPRLRDRASIKPRKRYEDNIAEIHVPFSYSEAVSGENAVEWHHVIQEELNAHKTNCTWTLVSKDPGRKPIKSKCVFKVAEGDANKPARFKARLCAKGFMQTERVDFTETFSPVVSYD